ncbi:probable galacturonosyltransferase 4 [Tanacetum coccineum]
MKMKMKMKMWVRKPVLALLFLTVLAPILLYTDKLTTFSTYEFVQDPSTPTLNRDVRPLNLLPQEFSIAQEEPLGDVHMENLTRSIIIQHHPDSESSRITRQLNEESKGDEQDNPIKQVTENVKLKVTEHTMLPTKQAAEIKQDGSSIKLPCRAGKREPTKTKSHNPNEIVLVDTRVRELRLRIKEVQKAPGDANKDLNLPKNAHEKLKAMDHTLAKGKQIQYDCTAVVKNFMRLFTQPKNNYGSIRNMPYNVLVTAVVVNSTVTNAKDCSKHVFHIVTDKLNYAAMRMWFLANPPGSATIQVQNIDEFTWLNASYSPVLKQLASQNMIDYYFKTRKAESDSNLKFRNPKYLSMMNHLRFYLPEIFPKLNKVVFLDDDIVVQKDLSGLWSIDLKGKVNGAVETCGENFHRFDRYLNFSNPIIAKNFDPRACGWAYGMNVFDLEEWKKQNITDVYHSWQNLNHERQLWKLGTLPPGLITFWKRVYPLDRSWHVLGLGYNPSVGQREIERAAVIHYNGNLKPWLEIGIPKFRGYWNKYVDYDQAYMRDCNMSP